MRVTDDTDLLLLRKRAAEVLHGNDAGGWTRASPHLYPHQWSWDSAFIAIGWAHLDAGRALTELEGLFAAQWPTGMVPHIVFWRPDDSYFPGPDVWATGHQPPTTGLTQPPLPVSAAAPTPTAANAMYSASSDRSGLAGL